VAAEHYIDEKLGIVFSRAWGVLTDEDLLQHQRRLRVDTSFHPALNQLFDFYDVTAVEVSGLGIRTLADRNPFGAGARRAFVVRRESLALYGLLRMFQALTSEHPDELRVQFEDVSQAQCWLGIPDTNGQAC